MLQNEIVQKDISFKFLRDAGVRNIPNMSESNGTAAQTARSYADLLSKPPASHSGSLGDASSAIARHETECNKESLNIIIISEVDAMRQQAKVPCCRMCNCCKWMCGVAFCRWEHLPHNQECWLGPPPWVKEATPPPPSTVRLCLTSFCFVLFSHF